MRFVVPVTVTGRVVLVTAAVVVSLLADLAVGASWPGRIAVVALASAALLVIVSKSLLAPILSRPAGARAGELGNPLDDLDGGDHA